MPTYEYRCGDCKHQFEVFQSITDDALESCPECEGKVERLIGGGTGLIFRGSGFYITDYKGSKPAEVSKTKGDSKKEPTASTTTNEAAAKTKDD